MAKTTLKIDRMHCSVCERMVGLALAKVKDVRLVSINSLDGTAVIDAKSPFALENAKKAIRNAGFIAISEK